MRKHIHCTYTHKYTQDATPYSAALDNPKEIWLATSNEPTYWYKMYHDNVPYGVKKQTKNKTQHKFTLK